MSTMPKYVYLIALGLLLMFAVKVFINSTETISPSGRMKNLIRFLEDTEAFETELVTLLKEDPFERLTSTEVEPIEHKISKENNEIQVYLKEFSPKDPLMIKDFEDTVQVCFEKIELLPQRAQKTVGQVLRTQELTKMKYNKILDRFESLKTDIGHLEDIGIPLTKTDLERSSNIYGDENVNLPHLLKVLRKLHEDLETLDSLHAKASIALKQAAQGDERAKSELKSLLDLRNRTELSVIKTIHTTKSSLSIVYSVAESRTVGLQEQINVLHQKLNFWHKEWNDRIKNVHKQLRSLQNSVKNFKETVSLQPSSYVIREL